MNPTKDNNNYSTNKWIKQRGKINKKNINNDLSLYLQKNLLEIIYKYGLQKIYINIC